MCLIIHAKPDIRISPELMDDFAKRNDDGFGVMYVKDNKIHAEKFGPTEMDRLYPTYEKLQGQSHFIHLRMRTHGAISADQSHPYYCGFGIWLMHNGVMHGMQGDDNTKSDTWYFINSVLTPLFKQSANPHEMMRSPLFARIMREFAGTSNRFVMGDRGGYVLFNTPAWHTIDNERTEAVGLLVSNTYAWSANSYGQPPRTYTHNNVTSFREAQGNLPLGQGNDESRTSGVTPTTTGDLEEAIKTHFYQLGRHWYIDKFSQVYKRLKHGFKRRPDLDDKDQFWNSFTADVNINAGQWIAEQNNVEPDEPVDAATGNFELGTPPTNDELENLPAVIAHPETIDPMTGEISQLVINWAAMGEKDLETYLTTHPARAAKALYHLTHNKQ
jgi:hypothetical protein